MTQLQELVDITEALYLKEQAAVQDILSQEAALRSKLAEIDQQVRKARDELSGIEPMQSIGADVVWQAWVGRAKYQLNTQLAQVLAQKEMVMDKVRRAFGKTLIASELAQAESKTKHATRQARSLAAACEVNSVR